MMADKLISASALANVIRDDPYIHGRAYARVRDHIDDAPAVDAVEVVRCKVCKLWQSHCNGKAGMCKKRTGIAMPNDFCSYGERGEVE